MTGTIAPDPRSVFERLFAEARAKDEFEYCCALLRIRGMEGPGWDPTSETFLLTQQVGALIQAPLERRLVLRLTLFLYCHVTEMADLYAVPANMCRILQGHRYSIEPLKQLPPVPKLAPGDPLADHVKQLAALAREVGHPELAALYETFFIRQVRNAFFHSAYGMDSEGFNIRRGEFLTLDGLGTYSIPFAFLVPRLELGINVALALLGAILDAAKTYQNNKVVRGRLSHDGSYVDIELTGGPEGLTGFRSPPPAPSTGAA
jgi:hypothetical protein